MVRNRWVITKEGGCAVMTLTSHPRQAVVDALDRHHS